MKSRACLLFLCVCLTLSVNTASATTWSLDDLMATLAQVKTAHARFTEKKYLSIAEQPVQSSGELAFTAPDHLEKRTAQPQPEDLVLDGNKLTVRRQQHTFTMDLAHYPEIAALVESIRATLAGNRLALQARFATQLQGDREHWAMQLTPLDSNLAKQIARITLQGTGAQLKNVEVQQTDGDRSVTDLQPESGSSGTS